MSRSIRWKLVRLVALAALAAVGAIMAHAGHVSAQKSESEVANTGFSVTMEVNLVTVAAAVLDKRGRYQTDLGREDFVLLENDKVKEILDFSRTEKDPLALAILLDVSGSMRFDQKLDKARWVIRQLLERLRFGEEAALMVFADDRVETAVPFTGNKRRFLDVLDGLEAYGKTALGDALSEAAALVEGHDSVAPALLLLTDGFDNASRIGMAQALSSLRWRGIPVYPLAVVASHIRDAATHPDAGSDFALLQRIAEETGGEFFVVTSPASMAGAVTAIERDLRGRYRLSFSGSSGGVRPIRLTVKVRKKGYRVRYRRGYRP